MSKIAVVYWSGTGNTMEMAKAVLSGAQEKGATGVLLTADEFDETMISSYDAIAFGCPAMGAEALEENEFEPMFTSCKSSLKDKKIALFGSYGWGSGEWMEAWENECLDVGAKLVCESVICNEAPGEDDISNCMDMGASLCE